MHAIALAVVSAVVIQGPGPLEGARPQTTKLTEHKHEFQDDFCSYPSLKKRKNVSLRSVQIISEQEPNDTLDAATVVPLTHENPDLDVSASNYYDEDDYFALQLQKGDILGVACRGSAVYGGLDPQIMLMNAIGSIYITNDDGLSLYPVTSPMPVSAHSTDSMLTFVVPADGLYHILVEPFPQQGYVPSQGTYTLQFRLRRNVFEYAPPGIKQIIYVDFDGATIPAQDLFGGATTPVNAVLSPMSAFLGSWGLSSAHEDAVINAVIVEMTKNFNRLVSANPGFDYEIRNSRDHPDTFGSDPLVTRVVIGGTRAQLGINTIGIAESIDPGNFDTSETALLLLDDLSSTDPTNPFSLNNVLISGTSTKIQLIGTALGNMAAHEVGHTLGNWHTDPNNGIRCIMDAGGVSTLQGLYMNYFETGYDGIFGNADDNESDFTLDLYFDAERVGMFPSIADTRTRTSYAMSGEVRTDECLSDLNGDGLTDGLDLGLLLSNWGLCPK